jgi:hypothetical protein
MIKLHERCHSPMLKFRKGIGAGLPVRRRWRRGLHKLKAWTKPLLALREIPQLFLLRAGRAGFVCRVHHLLPGSRRRQSHCIPPPFPPNADFGPQAYQKRGRVSTTQELPKWAGTEKSVRTHMGGASTELGLMANGKLRGPFC